MANCIKCGIYYCNCEVDGYCDKCLGVLWAESGNNQPGNPNCKYTEAILKNYESVLECLKQNPDKATRLNANEHIDVYLSYVKSALNKPSNYCQFEKILDSITPIIHNAIAFGICQK